MSTCYEHLFSPVTVGGLELANRAVMPAIGTGYGGRDGSVTERLVAYLSRRAAGGAGLIITEVCAVDPRGKGFAAEIGAWDDGLTESLALIPEAVHREGGKVALQLHHAGRETFEVFAGAVPEGPSPVPSAVLGQPVEEMNLDRIAQVIGAYASAARRAKSAGFDAVEVHAAHGYLIGQFLSPLANLRGDEYGGSRENRARFALDVVSAVRDAVGERFPVIVRVSVEEAVSGGYDVAFMEWLAPLLAGAGADAVHASVGVFSTPGNLTIASMDTPPGFNLERARAIRKVAGVPVIGVGRINDPRMADEAIARGDADLVSFGRQHLADPDFLLKGRGGDEAAIRFCLACNQGCIERMLLEMKPATCTINPVCGEEYRGEYVPAEKPLHVRVVGAGPAGLSAALAASLRGHRVEVLEAAHEPGGQLRAASRPPGKGGLARWVEWAVRMLERDGVRVRTGVTVTAETLAEGEPEFVVLATGSLPLKPPIPGIDGPNVVEAREMLLAGAAARDRAVVLGAGYVGMESADFLASKGAKVTVLEMLTRPPVGRHETHGYWLHRRLRDSGGTLVTGAEVVRIEPGAVIYLEGGEERRVEPAPTVVLALGARPDTSLVSALEDARIPHSLAGDAVVPGRLLEAVHGGHAAGLALPG